MSRKLDPKLAAALGAVGGWLLGEVRRAWRHRQRKKAAEDLAAAEKTETKADDRAAEDNYKDIE